MNRQPPASSLQPNACYRVTLHILRVVVAAGLLVSLAEGRLHHHDAHNVLPHGVEVALVALLFGGSLGLVLWAALAPAITQQRAMIGVALDWLLILVAMTIFAPFGSVMYLLYPVLLARYSQFFGRTFIVVAGVLSCVSFAVAVAVLEPWQDHLPLGVALVAFLAFFTWTFQYRAEEQARLRAEVVQANKRLHLAMRQLGNELRSPLNGLLGVASLMGMSSLTTDQRSYMRTINAAGRQMMKTIDDALDLSYMSGGRYRGQAAMFELRAVLANLKAVFDSKGEALMLTLKIDESVPDLVIGDSSALEQSLVKMIDGAMDRGDGSAFLAVDKSYSADVRTHIAFTVTSAVRVSPMESYDRDVSTLLVHEFVDAMGGTCTDNVTGPHGRGMSIVIPFTEAARDVAGTEGADATGDAGRENVIDMASSYAAHRSRSQPLHILVADDDSHTVLITQRLLQKAGHTVDTARSSDEILAQLERTDFSALVIDLHMPGLSGADLLKFIRASTPAMSQIPIVVMSADTSPTSINRVHSAGATAFVAKPVQTSRLLDVISNISNNAPPKVVGAEALNPSRRINDMILDHAPIQVMSSLGMDADAQRLFVDQCLSDADTIMRRLFVTASKGDWDSLRASAHSLSGVVSGIGLGRVSHMARTIYEMTNAILASEWEWRLNDLRTEMSQGRISVRKFVAKI